MGVAVLVGAVELCLYLAVGVTLGHVLTLVALGAALGEPELDLRRQVDDLLGNPPRLEEMGKAMRALAKPDAAEVVAEELMSLARP